MRDRVQEKNLRMYMKKNIENGSSQILVSDEKITILKEEKVLQIYLKDGDLKSKYIDGFGRKLYETTLIDGVRTLRVYEKDELVYFHMEIGKKKILWGFSK